MMNAQEHGTTLYAASLFGGGTIARAYCRCGWYGPVRVNEEAASEDAACHDIDTQEWEPTVAWRDRVRIDKASVR